MSLEQMHCFHTERETTQTIQQDKDFIINYLREVISELF